VPCWLVLTASVLLLLLLLLLLSRFYFSGWYNSGSLSCAHRYGTAKGTESPVMDDCTMTYLFCQVSLRAPESRLLVRKSS